MLKRLLFLGLVSGILANYCIRALPAVVHTYRRRGLFGRGQTRGDCHPEHHRLLIASLGYFALHRMTKRNTDVIFNLVFVILSCVSLLGPIKAKLPLDYDRPELFFGLLVPMHLFPVLGWLTLRPLFVSFREAA